MGNLSGWEIGLILLVVVLLFGAKKLPDTARGLGRSLRIFKAEIKATDDDPAATTTTTTTVVPPAQSTIAPPALPAPPAAYPVAPPVMVNPVATQPVGEPQPHDR